MAKPQQPELRRSGRVPALEPDASESKLSAERPHRGSDPDGRRVPEDQRPGHHPDQEQDQPDLDKFAERLGIVAEEDDPLDAPHVEDAPAARFQPKTRTTRSGRADADTSPKWSPVGLMLVGPVTGLLVARGALRALKRLRR